ncbi:uncharacterized protein DUF4349 [Nocardiopsis sp. L17-MgMaSL7]|nr:DUF4349 domain-containing protein [Nocardiopsis sp. L17-MgMaSL7]PWV49298.1 uncharacterized protein DUF4349 [Nocardiopsis sp. L17-MgMaSL7]
MDTSALTPPRAGRAAGLTVASGLAVLLLASCGASSDSGAAEPANLTAPERQADSGSGDEAGAEFSAEGALEAEDGAESGGDTDVEVADRRLVHTADMTVRVEDVAAAAERAKRLTLDTDGYVESESLSTPRDDHPAGYLTLRVPDEDYEGVLEDLAELGDRSMLERSVQDVTEEVADVESRIESSETALETLRGYLEEARDVDDLLRVEGEIQRRQEDLEALQARLKVLDNQTSYSTVHLTLQPPTTYLEEPVRDSVGFLGGLERGWRALVDLGQGLAVLVGWLLPFAVVVAVVGAWPLWAWRGRRRARRERDSEKAAGLGAGAPGGNDDVSAAEPEPDRDTETGPGTRDDGGLRS